MRWWPGRRPRGAPTSLRRQLFGSHVLVMVVALGVVVVGVVVAFTTYEIFSELDGGSGGGRGGRGGTGGGVGGRGSGRGEDPGGPLVLLVPVGAAALAAALVSWRVARRLAAPIEAARTATRQLTSGRYGVEVDGGDVAELVELAADVNRLGAELDATERRRLQLIGDVAHELRNPLATIEASMEALMDGVLEPTDETFAGIAREAARLRRLAGDLSELSATAEPSILAGPEPVDVSAVLTHVVDQLGPQAVAKGLDLRWVPTGGLVVPGDRDRLIQVFTNIVGNAVQYTDAGSVTVTAGVEPPGGDTADGPALAAAAPAPTDGPMSPVVAVTVTDTGRGLTPESQALVFERFHRVDHDTEGTGVGLAVARSLVRAHGGTIGVTSAGLGRGSRFTVRLPAGWVAGPPVVDQEAQR